MQTAMQDTEGGHVQYEFVERKICILLALSSNFLAEKGVITKGSVFILEMER